MRARKTYTISQLLELSIDRAIQAVGTMLDSAVDAANSVSLKPSIVNILDATAHNMRPAQIDGVYVVQTLGGAGVATRVGHNLNRVPIGFFEVKTVPGPAETQVDGEVRMISADITTVVLQCAGANKTVRLILF